jgi:hypothetical protein
VKIRKYRERGKLKIDLFGLKEPETGGIKGLNEGYRRITAELGPFGFFSFGISIFVFCYYVNFVLFEREKTAEEIVLSSLSGVDEKLKKMGKKKKLENEKKKILWNFNALDTSQLGYYKSSLCPHFSNVFEIFNSFLVPVILAFFNNLGQLPCASLMFLFASNIFYLSMNKQRLEKKIKRERYKIRELLEQKRYQEYEAQQEMIRAGKQGELPEHLQIVGFPSSHKKSNMFGPNFKGKLLSQEYGSRLETVMSLKIFDNWLKFLVCLILNFMWAFMSTREFTMTIWLSVISVVLIVINVITLVVTLVVRIFGDGRLIHMASKEELEEFLSSPKLTNPQKSTKSPIKSQNQKYSTKKNSANHQRSIEKNPQKPPSPKYIPPLAKESETPESDWNMDIPIQKEKNSTEKIPKTDEIAVQVVPPIAEKSKFSALVDKSPEFIEREDGSFRRSEMHGEPLTTERRGILDTEAKEGNFEDDEIDVSGFCDIGDEEENCGWGGYGGRRAIVKKPRGWREEEKGEERVVEGLD